MPLQTNLNGQILQVLQNTYLTNTNLSTAIPFDDTTPTSSEGTQILSQAITPATTTNKVLCSVAINGGNDTTASVISAALFNGSTCIAATCDVTESAAAGAIRNFPFAYLDSPASASSVTYTVRVGPNSGTACRLNGDYTQRRMGGVAVCSLTLMEVKA